MTAILYPMVFIFHFCWLALRHVDPLRTYYFAHILVSAAACLLWLFITVIEGRRFVLSLRAIKKPVCTSPNVRSNGYGDLLIKSGKQLMENPRPLITGGKFIVGTLGTAATAYYGYDTVSQHRHGSSYRNSVANYFRKYDSWKTSNQDEYDDMTRIDNINSARNIPGYNPDVFFDKVTKRIERHLINEWSQKADASESAYWESHSAKPSVISSPVVPGNVNIVASDSSALNSAAKQSSPFAQIQKDIESGRKTQYSGTSANYPVKR